MKNYVTVVRTNLDELPILSTPVHQRAYGKARSVTDKEIDEAAEVMGVDHAGRVCTAVIVFEDERPIRVDIVKDLMFGDEQAVA